jgi:hypothetical protein
MGIPIISTITAKMLVLAEGVLDYFVTLTATPSADHCSESLHLNGALTECGEELVTALAFEKVFDMIMETWERSALVVTSVT